MLGVQLVELVAQIEDLPRLNFDVRGGPLCPTGRLMQHDPGMWQRGTLLRATRSEQERSGGRRHPHTDRVHRCLDVLHGVVDRHGARNDPAGRIDVDVDVPFGIIGLEEQELGDDDVRDIISDRRAKEYDAVHKEAREDVVRALPSTRALDYVRRIDRRHVDLSTFWSFVDDFGLLE